MHWQFWLIFLPVAVVIVALSVVNRDPVPFGIGFGAVWQVPLFLLLLASGLLGILIGGSGAWLAGGRSRRRARRAKAEAAKAQDELAAQQRKAAALQVELDALRGDQIGASAGAQEGPPPAALPARTESSAA